MKRIAALACVAVAALAGCASMEPNTAVDNATCQLGPTTITSITGVRKEGPVNRLDQSYALMQLSASDWRYRSLAVRGPVNNLTEDVLRECRLSQMDKAS